MLRQPHARLLGDQRCGTGIYQISCQVCVAKDELGPRKWHSGATIIGGLDRLLQVRCIGVRRLEKPVLGVVLGCGQHAVRHGRVRHAGGLRRSLDPPSELLTDVDLLQWLDASLTSSADTGPGSSGYATESEPTKEQTLDGPRYAEASLQAHGTMTPAGTSLSQVNGSARAAWRLSITWSPILPTYLRHLSRRNPG